VSLGDGEGLMGLRPEGSTLQAEALCCEGGFCWGTVRISLHFPRCWWDQKSLSSCPLEGLFFLSLSASWSGPRQFAPLAAPWGGSEPHKEPARRRHGVGLPGGAFTLSVLLEKKMVLKITLVLESAGEEFRQDAKI
jgi:hypothetical protein